MRKGKIIFWIIVIVAAVVILGVTRFRRANENWQSNYREKVSSGIVELLQTNPYDQVAVVVIVIDGLRWDEGIGAEDRYIPHIWNDLRPLGTLLTNYWIASPTATTSSHSAMLTGRISTVPNDGHIRPVFPTFLEYFRDARMDYIESAIEVITDIPPGIFQPDELSRGEVTHLVSEAMQFDPGKTALYFGKDLIYSLNQSSSGRYPDNDVFLMDSMRDIEATEFFRAKIPDVRPSIVVVNLGDVDECGHEVEWYYYTDAIEWADKHVWEMWQALQAETRYRDRTYFIITTDHGRHLPDRGGYPHHGCFCDGCRHSFMLVIGPNIKQDFVSDEPHSELDLAPTIGRAIGFSTPACSGEPMMEIFDDPSSLPEQRVTQATDLVESDRARVDDRDTAKTLLDAMFENAAGSMWRNNVETGLIIQAIAFRINTHPDEAEYWAGLIADKIPTDLEVNSLDDLLTAYPLCKLGYELSVNSISWGTELYNSRIRWLGELVESDLIDFSDPATPDDPNISEISFLMPFLVRVGNETYNPEVVNYAFTHLLNVLEIYQGYDRVWNPGLEDFIDDYYYRQPPNEIFTKGEISMRDRMWLLWSIERVLSEAVPSSMLEPELYNLLNRQYRLLIAFTSEWQDANAIVGGSGDIGEEIDFVVQGLSLSTLADFKPWRRWELDELGYSMNIYTTPIFSWPPIHFFYTLGQANALAGGWAANERLQLYVNDDGSIRHDLLDSGSPIMPSDPDYPMVAATLAYGLSRFELADYQIFDLELYPIIHQQSPD